MKYVCVDWYLTAFWERPDCLVELLGTAVQELLWIWLCDSRHRLISYELFHMNLYDYVLIDMNLFNAYIDVNAMSFAMMRWLRCLWGVGVVAMSSEMNIRAMIAKFINDAMSYAMNPLATVLRWTKRWLWDEPLAMIAKYYRWCDDTSEEFVMWLWWNKWWICEGYVLCAL